MTTLVSSPEGAEDPPMIVTTETQLPGTVDSVLDALRSNASSNRELGDSFERLMRAYLAIDPLYAERFEQIWLWQDWPDRGTAPDTGIDLVATERDWRYLCDPMQVLRARPTRSTRRTSTRSSPASGKEPSPSH